MLKIRQTPKTEYHLQLAQAPLHSNMYLLYIAISTLLYTLPTLSAPANPSIPHRLMDESPYHPRCRTAKGPPPGPLPNLHPTVCESLIPTVCRWVTPGPEHLAYRDRWVWANKEGCALGYYSPQAAEPPEEVECQFWIYKALVDKCAFDSRFNAGGINVEEMPDWGTAGTAAEDDSANRYFFASMPLTKVEDSVVGTVVNKTGNGSSGAVSIA